MNILLFGHGKTGSLVDEVARERNHRVTVLTGRDNANACSLTRDRLRAIDAVIDFTAPHAAIPNIEACCRAHANIVVGTTGWYSEIPRIRELVEKSGIGLVYASNFSVGVNLFFDIARLAATAARHGYTARIVERHHIQKKDAPSGTAVTLRQKLEASYQGTTSVVPDAGLQPGESAASQNPGCGPGTIQIDSIREGDIVGEHTIVLDSSADTITLQHTAKSRRGFAEGAVAAAEWIKDKRGFYEFHDILAQL